MNKIEIAIMHLRFENKIANLVKPLALFCAVHFYWFMFHVQTPVVIKRAKENDCYINIC